MNERLKKITLTGMFAALICVATMFIQIPTITKGYVNLGDCFVLIAAWICGPLWGAAAAGIGSALADVISGYAVFAPGTFVIKATMAVIAALIASAFKNRVFLGRAVSAACAEIFMAFGYFVYEWIVITGSFESSVIGIPENLVQGVVGLLAAVSVITALERTKAFKVMKLK